VRVTIWEGVKGIRSAQEYAASGLRSRQK
jgi:hypothetical protein